MSSISIQNQYLIQKLTEHCFPKKESRGKFLELFGNKTNTLLKGIRDKKYGGKYVFVPFEFEGNRLKNPEVLLKRHPIEDLSLVEAIGWHIYSPKSYGNFVLDYTVNNIRNLKEIEDLKKQGFLIQADSRNCVFLNSMGAKAKKLLLPNGEETISKEVTFYKSPLCVATGSSGYFHKSRGCSTENSEQINFYNSFGVNVFNCRTLNLINCSNIKKIADCYSTDLIETNLFNSIKNKKGDLIVLGKELPWYKVLWYKSFSNRYNVEKLTEHLFTKKAKNTGVAVSDPVELQKQTFL